MKVIEQIIEYLCVRGRLTSEDLVYLAKEGFCYGSGEEDDIDDFWIEPYLCNLDASDDPYERLTCPKRRRSRPLPPKGALKAVDIRDHIAEGRPAWERVLAPIVSLARRVYP